VTMSISFQNAIGKKVLIIGDVGAGKTKLTMTLLDEALAMGLSQQITIIDLAPATRYIGSLKVGGQLREFSPHLDAVRYLTPDHVETPRISATSPEELQHLVILNKQRFTPLLQTFLHEPSPILFINDVSLYLQAGALSLMTQVIHAADTCVINGYYGQALQTKFEDSVSCIERHLMDCLIEDVDIVIIL
jgi:hypothetical protein